MTSFETFDRTIWDDSMSNGLYGPRGMEGHIEQVGTPEELFATPKTLDVVAFLGSAPLNSLPARVESRSAHAAGQATPRSRDYGAARDVVLGIHPGAIRLLVL